MISQGTCDKIGGAGKSMKQASDQMQQMNPSGGAQHGRSAQDQLAEALGDLESMMNGDPPQPGQQGSAGGPPNKPGGDKPFPFGPAPGMRMGKDPGGKGGLQKGDVEFFDDYKPPAAFRKELQEAMKEASPEAYEAWIKEYYKELIQ